jgi:hypothetical protein
MGSSVAGGQSPEAAWVPDSEDVYGIGPRFARPRWTRPGTTFQNRALYFVRAFLTCAGVTSGAALPHEFRM